MPNRKPTRNSQWIRIAVLVFVLALVATACSSDDDTTDETTATTTGATETTASSADPVELSFWTILTTEGQATVIQAHANECAAELDNVTVKFEAVSFGDLYTSLLTAFNSGTGPDLMNTNEGAVAFSQFADYLVPVDDVLAELGDDAFIASYVDAVRRDGSVWAIPDWALHHEVWYRTDVFEEMGLEIPQSWPELLAAATAIEEADNGLNGFVVPLSATQVAPQTLYQFLYSNGVHTFNPDTGEYEFGEKPEEAIEAIQMVVDLYQAASPADSLNWAWGEFRTALVEGRTGMVMDFGAVVGQAQRDNPDMVENLSAFPLPPPSADDPRGAMLAGGYYYMVGKSEPAREAVAKELLGCMMTAERMAERTNTRPVFALPSLHAAAETDTFLQNESVVQFDEEIEMIRTVLMPLWYRYGMEAGLNEMAGQIEATTFIGDAVQAAAIGEITAEEAFNQIDAEFRRLLEN